MKTINPKVWKGLKYPDTEVVALTYRYARPENSAQDLHAIDVGCGAGRHTRFLNEIGYSAYGTDNDEEMCDIARSNGIEVIDIDARDHHPEKPLALALCWGFMMIVKEGPEIVAGWKPKYVIADWRTNENSCFHWPETERLAGGVIKIHRAGHTLDGLTYFLRAPDECHLPGYERLHFQTVKKTVGEEVNEWYQTVHRILEI